MESFKVDDFATFEDLAEAEETSNIFIASETTNVKKEDVVPIEFIGGLMESSIYFCFNHGHI